jgi:hypothetical protein
MDNRTIKGFGKSHGKIGNNKYQPYFAVETIRQGVTVMV